MSEHLYFPLAVGVSVEMSYNDGSTSLYTPTSDDSIGVNTRTAIVGDVEYWHYSWSAATAGKGPDTPTGDVNGSICPKGWKLPYNYTIDSSVSWGSLTNSYNITANGANTDTTTGYSVLGAVPISIPLLGVFYIGSYTHYDNVGCLWSSTGYDSTNSYYLDISRSIVYPQRIYPVKTTHGLNIRCVASPLAH